MPTLNVYLYFKGNCENAFDFYKTIFGGEYEYIGRYKDVPKKVRDANFPYCTDEQIMHVSLPISKETVLMGADMIHLEEQIFEPKKTFSLYVRTDSKKEGERVFNALSEDGDIVVPFDHQFWGSYYGLCIDKFGISWKVSCTDD